MKIAITGGTGFIGGYLARDLVERGHEVVLIARGFEKPDPGLRTLEHATFVEGSVIDTEMLGVAFSGCDAIADCAGTSREDGHQTYRQVHVDGARSVVAAARQAGVPKLVLVSFLRVRPGIRSTYHTTKWEGEEIVRQSGLAYTVVKAGLVYGPGDHLLNRLGGLFRRMPVFATVGLRERTVRPIAVEDLVDVLRVAVLEDRLAGQTVAVVGPEELPMSAVAKRVAMAMGKSIVVLPFPVAAQRLLGWFSERFMPEPLVSASQIEMLADGISEPLADSQMLPEDLAPRTLLTEGQIRRGLPA
jgi:NADH dehydrogenase